MFSDKFDLICPLFSLIFPPYEPACAMFALTLSPCVPVQFSLSLLSFTCPNKSGRTGNSFGVVTLVTLGERRLEPS